MVDQAVEVCHGVGSYVEELLSDVEHDVDKSGAGLPVWSACKLLMKLRELKKWCRFHTHAAGLV